MRARAYQNTVQKIRNRYVKYGTPIYITKVGPDQFLLKNEKWQDEIEMDYQMTLGLMQVGYFRIQKELDDLQLQEPEKIIVSDFVLRKKYNNPQILPFLSLVGSIVCLGIAAYLYFGSGYSNGTITYTLTGNLPGEHIVHWMHAFILGIFLLIVSAYLQFTMKKETNKTP